MEQTTQEQVMEDNRHVQIENAKMMQELVQDSKFKALFQDVYVDAFAITNTYNMWAYDDAGRRRFLEKTLARSHFVKFIDDILEDGRNAIQSLQEDKENASEEQVG